MQKQCQYRRCGQVFETEYPQKQYCTTRCRVAEKNARGYEKQPNRPKVLGTEDVRIENPTTEQLAAFALLYSSGAKNEPTTFHGIVPEWTAPHGIMWWPNMDHTEWTMKKMEMTVDPFSVFAQQALETAHATKQTVP